MSARSLPVYLCVLAVSGCESVQDLGDHAGAVDARAPDSDDGGGTRQPDGAPSAGDAADAPVESGHEGKILFVTDHRYTGDLATEGGAASGLAGADSICNMEARAAGIGGVFKAWVSTGAENARERIAPVGPWRLVEGTVIFPGRAVVGFPLSYPRFTAKGEELFASDAPEVWTGTSDEGTVIPENGTCAAWMSGAVAEGGSYGIVVSSNGEWTEYLGLSLTTQTSPCSARLRLYCFEQ